jgi:hypothetical protein
VALTKDPSLLAVLDRFAEVLGDKAFAIVDHLGCRRVCYRCGGPADHARLVYISTWPLEHGVISFDCEFPSG